MMEVFAPMLVAMALAMTRSSPDRESLQPVHGTTWLRHSMVVIGKFM